MSKFIPTGRTSRVRAGDTDLQVQTEYAYRPFPRITSTILSNGKVLHKLEKKLELPVDSKEEQQKIEAYIKKQHAIILDTIHNQTSRDNGGPKPEVQERTPALAPEVASIDESPALFEHQLDYSEKILAVPGTQDLYHLNKVGDFLEPGFDQKFRDEFPAAFRNLRDLLEVFPIRTSGHRERGVYEIERDRLYLISLGEECYFASVRRTDGETRYERAYKAAISESVHFLAEK